MRQEMGELEARLREEMSGVRDELDRQGHRQMELRIEERLCVCEGQGASLLGELGHCRQGIEDKTVDIIRRIERTHELAHVGLQRQKQLLDDVQGELEYRIAGVDGRLSDGVANNSLQLHQGLERLEAEVEKRLAGSGEFAEIVRSVEAQLCEAQRSLRAEVASRAAYVEATASRAVAGCSQEVEQLRKTAPNMEVVWGSFGSMTSMITALQKRVEELEGGATGSSASSAKLIREPC